MDMFQTPEFKVFYDLLKDHIVSAAIIIYLLYEKGVINFLNKDSNNKQDTDNTKSIIEQQYINESISKDLDRLKIRFEKIYEKLNDRIDKLSKDIHDQSLGVSTSSSELKLHEDKLVVLSDSVKDIIKKLDELNKSLNESNRDVAVIKERINSIEDKIRYLEKEISNISDTIRSNQISGDLRNGFR